MTKLEAEKEIERLKEKLNKELLVMLEYVLLGALEKYVASE